MPLRRTAFAFAATFICALIVFTVPRIAWNTVHAAVGVGQQPDTTVLVQPPATIMDTMPVAPPAAPRPLGARLVGLFGIVAILGIGFLL